MAQPPLIDNNSKTGMMGIGSLPSQSPVASFNVDGIKNLLDTKSFIAYHIRSAPNPNKETLSSPVNPNTLAGGHRGRIYYGIRPLGVVPQQFKMEDRLVAQGVWGKGSVLFNVTGEYMDNGPDKVVHIRNGDIIAINDTITTLTEQLFEYNPSGPQRLNYKVKGVDVLFDEDGDYQEGRDFNIVNYQIVWVDGGKKPNKIGKILSCVYYHTPIFIVQSLPHWLRIIPSNNMGHGAFTRAATYAPQQIVALQSTHVEENNIMDWFDLPPLPDYPSSGNTTGGSV